MSRYTVEWIPSARRRLAQLWVDNPAVRTEIAAASDEVEVYLAQRPNSVGEEMSASSRFIVRPPIAVLYRIFEDDCKVRVIHVKFWDE
jgi:hypothetical protein